MKYYLYYTKDKKFFDIKKEQVENGCQCIQINEQQKHSVLNALREENKIIEIIDKEIIVRFNTKNKRKQIVEQRDIELQKLDIYYTERRLNDLKLATEDIEKRDQYRTDLLNLPQAFDKSQDQENFVFAIVDEKNDNAFPENVLIIKKPLFIK